MDSNLAILLPLGFSWVIVLIVVVPALGGLLFARYGFLLTMKGHRSKKWPTVEGVILESNWKQEGHGVEGKVKYKYVVKGKEYVGNRRKLFDGEVHWLLAIFQPSVNDVYWKGKQVVVYYDPDKPGKAILEPGIQIKYVSYILIGLWMMAGGLFFAWMIAQG